ncbi:MAG: zinc finger Ran-binding domain-containing protein [Chloroflexota bacterium]|nr:zinc finger Ran-binding domain-containing protein [Chloroflexota bacterium]
MKRTMVFADGWTCPVCWKSNRAIDPVCYRCKTPRGVSQEEAEEQRKALAALAERPEPVPDWLVALPVVIFRGYAKAWRRGAFGALGFLALMVFGGVTDVGWLIVTGLLAAGLFVSGLAAGEVIDGMRNREVWAFIFGIALAVIGLIGSIGAFQILAPGLFNPTAIRWGSVVVFGGAGVAAAAGLVLVIVRREPT